MGTHLPNQPAPGPASACLRVAAPVCPCQGDPPTSGSRAPWARSRADVVLVACGLLVGAPHHREGAQFGCVDSRAASPRAHSKYFVAIYQTRMARFCHACPQLFCSEASWKLQSLTVVGRSVRNATPHHTSQSDLKSGKKTRWI